MKSAEAAAAASGGRHPPQPEDGDGIPRMEEGKYDWHTVVDGLSKLIMRTRDF